MPDQPKISFQLTQRDAKRLEVRVSAPGGETRGETDLPDASLLDELTTASASTGKLPGALAEKAGKALYNTLVSESVDELVIDTLNDAIRANAPVLFELRFDADQIEGRINLRLPLLLELESDPSRVDFDGRLVLILAADDRAAGLDADVRVQHRQPVMRLTEVDV